MQAFGNFGKRIVAYLVLLAAGLLALKLVAATLVGLFQAVVTIVLVVVLAVGVLWALRHV
jgi:hypothetical protein